MSALLAIAVLAGPAYAHDPWEAASAYRVSVETEGPEDQRKTIVLNIVEKATGAQETIRFFNRTFRVADSFHLPRNHYLVKGTLGTGGDILSVVDLDERKLVDTIWGYRVAFTQDRTKAVYRFRVPPRSVPRYISTLSVLAYDFEKGPMQNAVGDNMADPEKRGLILYPEEFREKGTYFIPAGSPSEQRRLRSDFVWCDDNSALAFVEWFQGASYLVVIDVSKGLDTPNVQRNKIDIAPFLADKYRNSSPPEHELARGLFVKSIQFVDQCQAVRMVSTATTILAERGVVLSTDGTVRHTE